MAASLVEDAGPRVRPRRAEWYRGHYVAALGGLPAAARGKGSEMTARKRGIGSRTPGFSEKKTARTPFQIELIRLIEAHAGSLGETSGRALSARLGKSSNHLWQILNRGMIPSGPAILDLARVLDLEQAETEGLILKAIETKGSTRSRDGFWIGQVR